MKILLSAYACEPNRGSEYGHGWNWALKLAEQGHEVHCLTRTRARQTIEDEAARLGVENLFFHFVPVSGWVRKGYRFQPGVYLHYLVWQRQAYRYAKELSRSHAFDLVHHVTLGSLQMGSQLWRLGVPFFLGPIGGGQEAPRAFKCYFGGDWKTEVARSVIGDLLLRLPNTRSTLRRASLVLATNAETERVAKRLGARRVERFLDGSLPESFFPESLPTRPADPRLKILWTGRLFARKGLPLVLEALGRVSPAVDFEFSIVGDGPMRRNVSRWISENRLQKKARWLGQVPWEQVRAAYARNDIFLFCSLRDSNPSQLLEAMAFGLPVITLDLHGSGTLVPDEAGIKVAVTTPAETVRGIATAVERLHANPELRRSMGEAGYAFARAQTWEAKVARMQAHYARELQFPTVAEPVTFAYSQR